VVDASPFSLLLAVLTSMSRCIRPTQRTCTHPYLTVARRNEWCTCQVSGYMYIHIYWFIHTCVRYCVPCRKTLILMNHRLDKNHAPIQNRVRAVKAEIRMRIIQRALLVGVAVKHRRTIFIFVKLFWPTRYTVVCHRFPTCL
jgi:hypothetical protein